MPSTQPFARRDRSPPGLTTGRLAACAGKTRYATAGKAFDLVRRLEQRRDLGIDRKDQTLTAYRCPYCHGWHVGSTFRDD